MIALGLGALAGLVGASLAAGFGVGRIHSKATVSAIESSVKKAGADVETGVKDVAADIKKKL